MQQESLDALAAIVRGLDAPVRDMLAEDLPLQRDAVRKALAAGDLEAARLEVHGVRGSAAFCRLEALRDAASALEASLSNNEKNAGHTRAFENNIERILHVLEQIENR